MPEPREVARRIGELRKAGELGDAIQQAETALVNWPDDVDVRRAYAWCVWQRDIKPVPPAADAATLDRALATAKKVLEWTMSPVGRAYEKFDPTPFIGLQAARQQLKGRRLVQAVDLLRRLEPERLSLVSDSFDYDPPRTQWFDMITKALTELGRWNDLALLASGADRSMLTGKNVQWIEYRLARAALRLGRPQEALDGLERALRGKNDAWVQVLKAEVLTELGRRDEALGLLRTVMASSRRSDFSMLINGVRNLARLLAEHEPALAIAHLGLVARILGEQGWSPKDDETQLAARLGIALRPVSDAELDELRRWWGAAEAAQRLSGVVHKLLAHGSAGFVRVDDGSEYYFAMSRRGEQAPSEGTKVTFLLQDGFDKKRNRPTKVATKVKVAKR